MAALLGGWMDPATYQRQRTRKLESFDGFVQNI
jgi:hypothetical protein